MAGDEGRLILSPLLATVLSDEVDRALQHRGHRFTLYADDCNVSVRSQKAGTGCMSSCICACTGREPEWLWYLGVSSPAIVFGAGQATPSRLLLLRRRPICSNGVSGLSPDVLEART